MAQIQAGVTYTDGGQVTATNLNAHVNNAVLVPGAIQSQSTTALCQLTDSILLLQSGALKQVTISQVQTAVNPSLAPYLLRDGSQPMTGQLTLASSTPTAALHATPKTYVDTGLATKQASLGYTPVNKAGDSGVGSISMSGSLTLAANPAAALEAATKQYVDSGLATKQNSLGYTPLNKAGDTATGDIIVGGPMANPAAVVSKSYVDAALSAGLSTKQNALGYTPLNKAGDTATGDILLAGPLASASSAVTKNYVDSGLANKQNNLGFSPINKSGDSGIGALSFSGSVTLASNPTQNLQAATKQYVDSNDVLLVPPGAIMPFYRATAPNGWVACEGQSATAYPNLVAIGITQIPDLRDQFIRGSGPSRAVATTQTAYAGYNTFTFGKDDGDGQTGPRGEVNAVNVNGTQITVSTERNGNFSATVDTIPGDTRPTNVAFLFCIKI